MTKSTNSRSIHPIVKLYRVSRSISTLMAGLVMLTVFYRDPNYYILAGLFVYVFIWPQVAFVIARNSKDPKNAELRNLLTDSLVLGGWTGLLHLNLWPSLTLMMAVAGMTMLTGGFRFLMKGLSAALFGYLVIAMIVGFGFSIDNNPLTAFASAAAIFLFSLMTNFIANNQTKVMIKMKKESRTQKERMEGLATKLAKYLSPQVYGSIFSGEKDVKVETYRKKLTVFFSDIEGFTALTESMESEELTSLLNTYLNEMSNIAIKYGGTIDKYIGDSIMIFFGDPTSKGVKQDAMACVSMALEMKKRMNELRAAWANQGISKPLKIRIGINTGFCTVGNFGSDDRLDYTIIGNQVNLASRLETNAETDEILISNETYMLIKDKIHCEKKDLIEVKGVAQPVQTYKVIDFNSKLDGAMMNIREVSTGLKLSVDFNPSKKGAVIAALKKIIADIE